MIGGATIVAISVIGYHLASSLVAFMPFRLLTGVGEAAMFVGAATAAQDLAPDHRRGEAASIFSVALYGGLAVGPAAGDFLYDAKGAGWVWSVAAGCLIVAALLGFFVPSTPGATTEHSETDVPVRRKFLHPAAIWPGIVLFCGLHALVAFTAFLPLYVDDIDGVGKSGQFFIGYGVLILVIRLIGKSVPDRYGAVPVATVAMVTLIAGMIAFTAFPSLPGLWFGTMVFSVGQALLFPAMFVRVVNQASEADRSHAVGTFSLFFDLSQGLGALILGLVVAQSSNRGAFAASIVAMIIGTVVLRTVVADGRQWGSKTGVVTEPAA